MTDLQTRPEAMELLEKRIEESGLKTSTFALDVLIREPRTIRRWLAGDSPIPNRVLEWLQEPGVAPWPPPALTDVPQEDRERFAEEVADEIARAIVLAATAEGKA